MSKRPLIYKIVDEDGALIFESRDKREAMIECRQIIINYPMSNVTFAITQNSKRVRNLALFSGDELIELLEDELD